MLISVCSRGRSFRGRPKGGKSLSCPFFFHSFHAFVLCKNKVRAGQRPHMSWTENWAWHGSTRVAARPHMMIPVVDPLVWLIRAQMVKGVLTVMCRRCSFKDEGADHAAGCGDDGRIARSPRHRPWSLGASAGCACAEEPASGHCNLGRGLGDTPSACWRGRRQGGREDL